MRVAVGAIRRGHVAGARQGVGVEALRQRVRGIAGATAQANIDISVGPFPVVRSAAAVARVVRGQHLRPGIGLARRGTPRPAIATDFARVVEVVERDELVGQRVKIRRGLLREFGQRRVAVALAQVAKHLIVGAVFLDDVDDVLDVVAQSGHHLLVFRADLAVEPVVLHHLPGELKQLAVIRNRQAQQGGAGEVLDVLVGAERDG